MIKIAENLSDLLKQIREFEEKYQRPAGSVTLLAVSKKQSLDKLRAAVAAGQQHFAENYLQEAEEKQQLLADPSLIWHFIGPIQSNKTRAIATAFDWVHSVDREKIARRLSEQRPAEVAPLQVCVQVNLSGEGSKSGIALQQCEALCRVVADLPHLTLRGLMAIPAPEVDFERQRQTFGELAQVFSSLQREFSTMDTLSMGMSGDFEAAIAEGATMVRLGTALFGSRA